jgi:hypothetical protein
VTVESVVTAPDILPVPARSPVTVESVKMLPVINPNPDRCAVVVVPVVIVPLTAELVSIPVRAELPELVPEI